ncbi:MAG: tail fiber protein [Dehalococcoidia bacterium]
MTDPFVAEIRMFGFNFAPTGWALCDGQILPISQNTALFSLLGTVYGGDGKSTFALPNLQGSVPLHPGQGPGLSLRDLGEQSGVDFVTLLESEIPGHAHSLSASNQPGEDPTPQDRALARSVGAQIYQTTINQDIVQLAPTALAVAGASLPHNNMMPYLTLNFCIALQGVFPPRQ